MSQSPHHEPRVFTPVVFRAEIPLTRDEVDSGDGRLAQAVQNIIGHTGAVVLDARRRAMVR